MAMKKLIMALLFVPLVSQAQNFNRLDSMVNHWIDKGYYPGAAICVMHGDNLLFHKTYCGYNDNTQVYVASAGKWVAAATIAAVVDNTTLDWNDPIEKWLPEFKGDPKGKVLLKNLLSHTSGIRMLDRNEDYERQNRLDSAIKYILPLKPEFPSQTEFRYGGESMQIAGRMAEMASKLQFEEIFDRYIAAPLGMTRSHFTPVNNDGGHTPVLGGGLCTTLHDYMQFLNMIYHNGVYKGQRILNKKTVLFMQQDQVTPAIVRPGKEYVEIGLGRKHQGVYGLGEWRELLDEKGDAYQISSPGWAGAYPWINKHDGVYGFFIPHVIGIGSIRTDGFSSFYGSPAISKAVSDIIAEMQHTKINK